MDQEHKFGEIYLMQLDSYQKVIVCRFNLNTAPYFLTQMGIGKKQRFGPNLHVS